MNDKKNKDNYRSSFSRNQKYLSLIDDFDMQFDKKLWSTTFDYIITENDLRLAHNIINQHVFDSKLDESVSFTICPYANQKGKGSFRFGYLATHDKFKQDFKFVQQSNDNFFKVICVLIHEMIHRYDFNFGQWSRLKDKCALETDYANKKQRVGSYDIHDNVLFESYMREFNKAGFNVQKLYSTSDKTFMKKMNEDDRMFFEDIDEEPVENRNLISAEYAKTMYDNIKTSGYKNIVVKPDGSWMIEVE